MRGTPWGRATIPKVPQMSQSTPEEPDFPMLPRISHLGSTHTTVARVTALCESLEESHRFLYQRNGKTDTAATAREESGRACLHSRRGLIPSRDYRGMQRSMSAVERKAPVTASAPYEDIAPTGEESRKAPHRSHGDWPFLRPQEWVPEVPVVNREESVATREKTGGFPLQVR